MVLLFFLVGVVLLPFYVMWMIFRYIMWRLGRLQITPQDANVRHL